jgi:hypothetical protein
LRILLWNLVASCQWLVFSPEWLMPPFLQCLFSFFVLISARMLLCDWCTIYTCCRPSILSRGSLLLVRLQWIWWNSYILLWCRWLIWMADQQRITWIVKDFLLLTAPLIDSPCNFDLEFIQYQCDKKNIASFLFVDN